MSSADQPLSHPRPEMLQGDAAAGDDTAASAAAAASSPCTLDQLKVILRETTPPQPPGYTRRPPRHSRPATRGDHPATAARLHEETTPPQPPGYTRRPPRHSRPATRGDHPATAARLHEETTPPQPPGRANQQPTLLFLARDLSMCLPVDSYDEVYPGILLGDQRLAHDKRDLERNGVTHILNAAQGERFSQVNTSAAYYSDMAVPLQYLGVQAMDTQRFALSQHFAEAAEFIEGALSSGGKVYVHCHQGISRSATLVLAFLMLKRSMTVAEAVKQVRQRRAVTPNDGFLKQLCKLNMDLYSPTPDPASKSTTDEEPIANLML